MSHAETITTVPPRDIEPLRGVRIEVDHADVARRGRVILRDVTFSIEPGEVVAVVGASGAGKSSLLETIAGLCLPARGTVTFDGDDLGSATGGTVGFVPQDDLIHRDLPVVATLRHAARLRLPEGTTAEDVDRAVVGVLRDVDLTGCVDVRVGDLSGGQRKRVSIAAELLTRPPALVLDEPTSGLDPSTATHLLATLRQVASRGTTVVMSTHRTDDLTWCDRVAMIADGGLALVGSPDQARGHLGLGDSRDLVGGDRVTTPLAATRVRATRAPARAPRTGARTQWVVLAQRNLAILRRNHLTLAIMLGAPALVIAMFALLFRPGALDPTLPDATAALSTTYWMAFAAFFFGLTYGLLQICTELPLVRRELFIGVRVGSYLAAKVTVLAPVLVGVNVAMLAVLRGLDRLPDVGTEAYGRLTVTLVLTSLAALALGLLASAAVADPAHATLALPMLCFPAVLFAGAVLPVSTMDLGGRAISVVVVARWSFEAAGRDLGLARLLASDRSGAGTALLAQHGGAFDGTSAGHWALLAGFAAALLAAAAAVVRRRAQPSP